MATVKKIFEWLFYLIENTLTAEMSCQMSFDWGETIQCETNASQIFVMFNIK
jgi:hypothetical protein